MPSALKTAQAIAGFAMLFEVIAGAMGYGETVKLWTAAGGASVALALKAAHLIG